jgi:hypothetical protein
LIQRTRKEIKISTTNSAPQKPAPATNKAPQTNADAKPDANVFTKEDLRNIRDQIRQNVRAQITGATDQGGPVTPAPPAAPGRTITIRGRDGSQTVVGLPPGFNARDVIPPQAVDISIAFFITIATIIIGLPIARAIARRMDRRPGPAQIPTDVSAQLNQLNQAVDAIALEVERISEGQRFTTRLLSEQQDSARQALPSATNR